MTREKRQSLLHVCVSGSVVLMFLFNDVDGSPSSPCPNHCHCYQESLADLYIDCLRDPHVDPKQLVEQLDSLLSSNLTYGHLTSLCIINTTLTYVPRCVCRLMTLKNLNFSFNQLTELPDNCFSNMTGLISLTASRNNIQCLQDGLFDGLQQLVSLTLDYNSIRSIGPRVFSNQSDLIALRYIDLSHNNLTSVEPWPIIRGLHGTKNSPVTIALSDNRISMFPNTIHWMLDCSKTYGFLILNLNSNNIRHVMDIMYGWKVNSVSQALCLFIFRGGRPRFRLNLSAQTFACDCVDYIVYAWGKAFPFFDFLHNCYCSPTYSPFSTFVEIPQVPLDQIICELTERCPSRCRCVHRPSNATLHIYCSNTNLTVLPLQLPDLPKTYTKYKLDFSNNRLFRRLENREYFANTSILDVSNCAIVEIEMDAWKATSTIKQLLIYGNFLTSLPSGVASVPMSASLSLDGNPWECSCRNRWMSKWLQSINGSLVYVDGILCHFPARLEGKNIIQISEKEFCADPLQEARTQAIVASVSSVSGVILLIVSCGVIGYSLRVKLYKRLQWHPFDRDECLGEDTDYDVFIACSSYDNLPDGDGIRVQLEERGFRICYSPRDFVAGESIYDNIYRAITRSKRTLCLLTANFPQSRYCMYEFETAYHHYIVEKRKKRLIVLMALDSPTDLYADDASDTAALRHFLRQYTYIDYTADDWLDKLLYALPLRGMDRQEQAQLALSRPRAEENDMLIALDGEEGSA